VIGFFVAWAAALVSYLALGIYLLNTKQAGDGSLIFLWVGATWTAKRVVVIVCMRRLQRIRPSGKAGRWFSSWFSLAVGLILFAFLFLMRF
jgi:hypothetical protein